MNIAVAAGATVMASGVVSKVLGADAAAPASWILAYFRGVYPEKLDITPQGRIAIPNLPPLSEEKVDEQSLHLALSDDLIHWIPLNENKPVMPGAPFIRDPFVFRDPRGGFHCLGTGGGRFRLLHTYSKDLVEWSPLERQDVMSSVPQVGNVWAPKCVAEPNGDWLVTWSSSYTKEGWEDSRIWCARTSDFKSFSKPKLIFDPGFTVIDAMVFSYKGKWRMVFKDERFGYKYGEHRYLQMAGADRIDGPYRIISERITKGIAEGPAMARHPDGRWFLFHDRCMDNIYDVLASRDLKTWTPVEGAVFPPNTRHGNVVAIAAAERERLLKAFPL